MKVAIFSDTFFPQINGVANTAYGSALALAGLGHEVVVFVPASKTNKNKLRQLGKVKVVFLPSAPLGAYPGERLVLPFSSKALNLFRRFKPDIIHSHSPFGAGWAAIFASKTSGAKLVGTHHTFFDHYLKHIKLDYNWGKKLSWRYTVFYYNFCDVVISPTQSLLFELRNHGLRRPGVVLSNSIDTELFHPGLSKEKAKLKKKFGIPGLSLVYMGRLSYEKSIDVVVEMFVNVLKKIPNARLMLVGDGPEKSKLENLCYELGIKDKVIFTGFVEGKSLAETLQANDVFVTASKSENMPLSLLEAKASGLPIVCVSEKGLKELVKDGVSGFLVPANDRINMMEAVLKILSDKKLREKMSVASRLEAEKYSSESVSKILENIYKNNGK